jgi:voltage-gated potassium channel
MLKRILLLLTFIFILTFLGAYFFMVIEGRSFFESLYFVVASITTVGYGDVVPLTGAGKFLAILLMVLGAGAVLAIIPLTFGYFMEKGIRAALGIEKIPKLRDHIIVCRYNDLADQAIEEIKAHHIPFVVIDDDEAVVKNLREIEVPHINGDPSEERMLEKAAIGKAKAIILASESDSENAFVAMASKTLNPKVKIIGRVNSDESVPIFERIGIDKIIEPHDIALKVLVKNALSPYAADLLDKISLFKDINLGQFQLSRDSLLVEKSIVETAFRDKTGASIVAVWREGEMHPNPSPDEVLQENDVLLVMGTASQLNRAKALVERRPAKKEFEKLIKEREAAKLRYIDAANEVRVRLPKVLLNALIILGLLFGVTVVLPSLTAIWTLIPHVGSALSTLLPLVAWIVIALIVFSILDDVRVLFNIASEALTGLFPGVGEGGNLNRALKDIIYAVVTVIFFTILSPFTAGTPAMARSLLSILAIVIPVFFLYDAGRILYKQVSILVDRVTEKVAGELEKK